MSEVSALFDVMVLHKKNKKKQKNKKERQNKKMAKKITRAIAGLSVIAFAGVAVLPLTTYAADPVSKDVTVSVTVNSTISLDLGGSSAATVANNSTNTGLYTTATVSTNNAAGYTLTFKDKDSNTSLVSGGNNIPSATGALSGTSKWGYQLSAAPTTTVLAIPSVATDVTGVGGTSAPSAVTGDAYSVYYGVFVDASQASGVYTDTLEFTATAKV